MKPLKIVRLYSDSFNEYRNDICRMLKESSQFSFPDVSFDDTYYVDRLNRIENYVHESSAIIFLALIDNQVVGWLWCHEIIRIKEKRIHIANITVDQQYRKHGIGQALLSMAEEYALDNEYLGIDLLVTATNKSAIDFYSHHGYETERLQLKKNLTNIEGKI